MSAKEPVQLFLTRLRWGALAVAVSGAALCVAGARGDWHQFMQSYLITYVLWLTVSLGAGAILMLNYVAGGGWGIAIRRLAEAAALLTFLMAILVLPLLAGLPELYAWARPGALAGDPDLRHAAYFHQMPFFVGRLAVYFIVWCGISLLLRRWSVQRDQRDDPTLVSKLAKLSGPGLPLYVLTISVAAVDLLMSLEIGWASTIIGFLVCTDCLLTALSLIILMAVLLGRFEPMRSVLNTDCLHDLGNLLLALVMFWAYIAFSQYLVIWMGNLPEEARWYLHRTAGGWQWVACALIGLHFALPFFLLLFRVVKRTALPLAVVALGMLVMRWVDMLWMVAPGFRPELHIHWLDVVVPLAMGGLWVAAFTWVLQRQPLLPLHERRPVRVSVALRALRNAAPGKEPS